MANANVLEELHSFKEQLQDDLARTERVLGDFETHYLQAEYSQAGTVLKGFESFLASKETLRKRQRQYKPEERLFSLSSRTTPLLREVDDGTSDLGEGGVRKQPASGFAQKGYAQKRYPEKGKR